MSEKGGTLFLIAIVVVIAGVLLTFMRPMFTEALESIRGWFTDLIAETNLDDSF